MASTPVSIRLDDVTLARLRETARAAQRPIATHAADLIRAGLADPVPSVPDGVHPLVAETLALFARVEGSDVKAHLEAALVLARVAAAGGAPATAAVRALRAIFTEIDDLTADDQFGDFLSSPTKGMP